MKKTSFCFILFILFLLPVAANTLLNLKLEKIERTEDDQLKVTVSWEDQINLVKDGYQVYSQVGEKPAQLIGTIAHPPLIITFQEDQPFFLIQIKRPKEEEFSESLTITWQRKPLPVPANLEIKDRKEEGESIEVELAWNKIDRAKKYYIYTLDGENKEKLGETANTSVSLSYPKYGDDFSLTVTSVNDFLESEQSLPLTIKRELRPTAIPSPIVNIAKPISPQNLRLINETTDESKRKIELRWEPAANADRYDVYASVDNNFKKIGSVISSNILLTILDSFPSFKVAVKAYNNKGESDFSNTVEIAGKKEEIVLNLESAVTPVISPPSPSPVDLDKSLSVEEKVEKNNRGIVFKNNNPTPTTKPRYIIVKENSEEKTKEGLLTKIINFFKRILGMRVK